ncbi:unnamed protein product [Adineta steineri]|uniref:Profilin n=1 Tax=Adineta steineri TaxID=433720 RepID=A0A818XU05_9BILA|nr:unnamed protein product [Adineta steineri]
MELRWLLQTKTSVEENPDDQHKRPGCFRRTSCSFESLSKRKRLATIRRSKPRWYWPSFAGGHYWSGWECLGYISWLSAEADDRSIYGKKALGSGGVILVKTSKTVIIGLYEEGQQPGNAAAVVEGVADYLINNGY